MSVEGRESLPLPFVLGDTEIFSQLLQALPAAVYMTDAAGRILFYNEAAASLWGARPEHGKSIFCGSWKLFSPDGQPLPHDQCPMALALKEQRPIRGIAAVAERPDGTRVPFMPYPTPLFNAAGALIGAVNMLVDLTEIENRRVAGLATEQLAAARLAAIVESSDDAIIAKDLNGVIMSWNAGAERLFGYTADEVIGKPITILIPDEHLDEEPVILERIRNGQRIDHYETVRCRKDGNRVDISLTVSPVRDAEGRIVGVSKIARDISERRRTKERQDMLIREMSHRVKNAFAVTSSVVTMSARTARTPEEMAQAMRERLSALTRAHDLTRPGLIQQGVVSAQDTTLHALLHTIFLPYDPAPQEDRRCFVIYGPDVPIGGGAVTSFALLFHELATNAAKYGALSLPAGRVEIDAAVEDDVLVLKWSESGGPSIDRAPDSHGFGLSLARRLVTGQLRGTIDCHWEPGGLVINVTTPLSALAMAV